MSRPQQRNVRRCVGNLEHGPWPACSAQRRRFVTVTQSWEGDGSGGEVASEARCAWCGRPFPVSSGPGRPRRYCRRSCRQRDFEARRRAAEHGLADHELIVTCDVLRHVDELVYVLACAVEDVRRDLAGDHDEADAARALAWLLEAATPLADLSRHGGLAARA